MWELIWISSATLWILQLLSHYYLPKAKIAILLFRKQFQRLPVTKKAFCSCFLLTLEFFPWDVKSGVWRQKSGVYFDETEVRVFSKKNAVSQYFLVVFLVTKRNLANHPICHFEYDLYAQNYSHDKWRNLVLHTLIQLNFFLFTSLRFPFQLFFSIENWKLALSLHI